ncbi:MAG: multidrug effflux MFS transporter [Gammaproteobacteria bacterium]|nr:multidrug effflux MFS transporter [Gammaproteobacteria bacterium]
MIIVVRHSTSAVVLSTLSDIFGASKVLKVAQIISISGLIVLGSAVGIISFYIGCILIGAGTGCYTAIARSIISRHAVNKDKMKQGFSNLSLFLVIAPILASYLARYMLQIDWRLSYYTMAFIEIILFCYAFFILIFDRRLQILTPFNAIIENFIYCLTQRQFVLNFLFIGISFAIFMQIIMANVHALLSNTVVIKEHLYNLFLLGMIFFYIGGIMTYRHTIHLSHFPITRIFALTLLLLGIIWFSLSGKSAIDLIWALYTICFCLGFLVPLSAGSGMEVIDRGHGAAAALFTFSFAITSSIWSFIEAHNHNIGPYKFMLMASSISISLLFVIALLFFTKRSALK